MSVLKFLMAEKCKSYGIYRKICHVYDKACFSQKSFYKLTKRGFVTTSLNQNDKLLNGNILVCELVYKSKQTNQNRLVMSANLFIRLHILGNY